MQIAEFVPVGDPFFGCILKGVLTTAISETVRCYRPVRERQPLRDRARSVFGCLRDHHVRMVGWFLLRTGRCMITAGFH
jgi:hypothetical protein